jgi:hypothetical protein
MGKKKEVYSMGYKKSNEVPWGNLKAKIDRLGVEKVIHFRSSTYDDGSVSFSVEIHLYPEKNNPTNT